MLCGRLMNGYSLNGLIHPIYEGSLASVGFLWLPLGHC